MLTGEILGSKEFLDAKGFAAMLGVSRRTFSRLRARGAIPPAVRIGGTLLRWRTRDIQRWLDKLPTR
jgi:predicted DNA-binding transcriptional regulator AlpA